MADVNEAARNQDEAMRVLRELLQTQSLAVLATHRGGQPYCNLVAFAATDDLKYVVFATPRPSRKYENLTENQRVSMLVDSRSDQDVGFQRAAAVTIVGEAEELPEDDDDSILELYLAKHPHLKEFVLSPNCALIQVAVEKYVLVRRFQEVTEFIPGQ